MTKKIIACITLVLLFSCNSVQQYNTHLETKLPVEDLKKDVDFLQKKIYKLHPHYDRYTSKEILDFKFDSLKKSIVNPMTPNEFYFAISPVLSNVKQGHIAMFPLQKKFSKADTKAMKKKGTGPLSQFNYDFQDNKLYVLKNKSKVKSIKPGSEIIYINNVTPQEVYAKFKKTYSSDGYNTTFNRKIFARRFGAYCSNITGVNDSLTFVIKQNDSVLTKIVKRDKMYKTVKATQEPKKDTIVKKTKAEQAIAKAKSKKEAKNKSIFGYNTTEKEYVKQLKFIGKDSLTAYLKIGSFSVGKFKKAYQKIFDSIQRKGCKTLIIDLRDNYGGRVNEIVELNKYLTDTQFQMTEKAEVTSKTSLWNTGTFLDKPKWAYPLIAPFYGIFATYSLFTVKKHDGKYYYTLSSSKVQQPKENNFKGKKYVLINGASFSASCILSSNLKKDKQIEFVGEETGGDFNGTVAGRMPPFKLPKSKLHFSFGLMDVLPVNQTDKKGRGVFPDKEITTPIQDKVLGKDLELDWILKQIYP